ncbi:MAG: hypothetical protein Q9227_004843 [Pyrenula ochraceoflavens]
MASGWKNLNTGPRRTGFNGPSVASRAISRAGGHEPSHYTRGPQYARTMRSNMSIASRAPARFGEILPRSLFEPGIIIRAMHFEQSYDGRPVDETSLIETEKHGPITAKFRFMIVVACLAESYIAVPLFTYGKTGLAKRRDKEEHISIRDHRALKNDGFENLSCHNPLITEHFVEDVNVLDPLSVAYFTYSVARCYDKVSRYQGHLTSDSTEHLLKLRRRFMDEAEVGYTTLQRRKEREQRGHDLRHKPTKSVMSCASTSTVRTVTASSSRQSHPRAIA